ncbi:MAG: type I DNA topoisomerase [Eubacteriales bacterium]|nr:type I DNA topoisomerase [Eubacteriales bacterium]
MSQKLVIVESPAKMKTIKKFLGSTYDVAASMGHVRDLPKSTMGVDCKNGFEPKYITIRGKGDLIADLKKAVKKSDMIYLATDPDREGEAISWHLMAALGLDEKDKNVKRITFNEITEKAVKEAIKKPRRLDMDLVDAQQARRVMDRVVGYSISPLLWEKIKKGLSAGRVQSATLNILCKREEEIAAFIPEEYWTIDATMKNGAKEAKASYYGERNGEAVKKTQLKNEAEATSVVEDVKGKEMLVSEVKKTERVKNPPLPFTTSTMQQDSSRLLNISTYNTMRIAQKLYEDGLITYLRTDSVRISDDAMAMAKSFIEKTYGEAYVSNKGNGGKAGQNVQDAHEAIRPTHIENTPESVKDKLGRDEYRLYSLIWNRFVASRMTPAVYDVTNVRLEREGHVFNASGSQVKFKGYLAVYKSKDDDEEKQDLSFLHEGDNVIFAKIQKNQHFTEPPAHYTEASLVKEMEELGIGRPSTYAPTITTLLARHYIAKEKKNLFVTELGTAVNDLMRNSFPDIADPKFTAKMEEDLDEVAEGKMDWRKLLEEFYPGLEKELEEAKTTLTKVKVADEVSDVPCDKCGRMMVIKYGPHGKFLACPGFPECRNTKPLLEKTGDKCPDCGADVIKRRTKKGRAFYTCENEKCEWISWNRPKKS